MSETPVLEQPASEVFRPAAETPETPELNALTVMRSAELEPMDKQSLILLCEQRDLSVTGTKEAIIERLLLWQEQQDHEARMPAPPEPVVREEKTVPADEDFSEKRSTLSLTTAELVLMCAAINSPKGRAETYSLVAERVSEREVIFSKPIPGDEGSYRYKVTLPPRVTVPATRY